MRQGWKGEHASSALYGEGLSGGLSFFARRNPPRARSTHHDCGLPPAMGPLRGTQQRYVFGSGRRNGELEQGSAPQLSASATCRQSVLCLRWCRRDLGQSTWQDLAEFRPHRTANFGRNRAESRLPCQAFNNSWAIVRQPVRSLSGTFPLPEPAAVGTPSSQLDSRGVEIAV